MREILFCADMFHPWMWNIWCKEASCSSNSIWYWRRWPQKPIKC